MMNIVSFVVDGLALHYYQAELLLFSLKHFSQHPHEDILVQCTNKVDRHFLNFLKRHNYNYKIIEPFLDGKYCNKIRQLEAFYERAEGNIFLLDTDMFALAPLTVPNENAFCAKIVDAANPPLHVIEKVFHQAAITLPDIVDSDWDLQDACTIASNFNGGFYYIPHPYIKIIADTWKKWATWLFERPGLFDNKIHAIYTDQIAMALAVCDSGIPYQALATNYNCPVHYSLPQKLFSTELPIALLHYHREINCFGLLKEEHASNSIIEDAIKKANHAIATCSQFEFYGPYRKSLVQPGKRTENTEKLSNTLAEFKTFCPQPLKFIVHAGTPKTGTTSMQFFLAEHQSELKKQGYLYPDNYSNTFSPKHQWLVSAFMSNDVNILIEEFNKIFSQVNTDIHTIILSTEGIYNHWFDFTQEAKTFLAVIAEHFELNVWIWFRKPLSFIDSFYCQNLKNPRMQSVACYGQDWSLEDMLKNEWFAKHLDYIGFVYEIETLLGKDKVKVFPYQENMITALCNNISFYVDFHKNDNKNTKLHKSTIEMLRIINRHSLNQIDKKNLLVHLSKIDAILDSYQQQSISNATTDQAILELSALGLCILNAEYKIDLA